ncbi:MAG: DNA-processing protein DprA [Leptospiraceae bacterium]|nr:DNA-processing protein DprA [Leptospiraceae bacterium]
MNYAKRKELVALQISGLLPGLKNAKLVEAEEYGTLLIAKWGTQKTRELLNTAENLLGEYPRQNISIICRGDNNYPEELLHLPDPPFCIFAKGNLNLLHKKKISIVGTRKPSRIGLEYARQVAKIFSEQSFIVVSGMARGIDTAAHRASIEASGTIGVIAHGFSHIYPLQNGDLFQAAFHETGNILLLSEYIRSVPPARWSFPRRNRIIAALSNNLIFVEGNAKSGAKQTAQIALDLGRDIYIFDDPLMTDNDGIKSLLEDGAVNLAEYWEKNSTSIPQSLAELRKFVRKNPVYLGNGVYSTVQCQAQLPFFWE